MRTLGLLLFGLMAVLYSTTATAVWDQECADRVSTCHVVAGEYVSGNCCYADGSCLDTDINACPYGGIFFIDEQCQGDSDSNGVDDACECPDLGLATACCVPDGTCADLVPPETCELLGGLSQGWCGSSCEEYGSCPPPVCFEATGECDEPHGTPGCNDPRCCGVICHNLPHCCEEDVPPIPATSNRGLIVAVVLLLSASAAVLLLRRRFAARN